MNCFEWQNKASDYLDGSLIGSQKREADYHLESCLSCLTLHRHYQQILSALNQLPRSSLPVSIRKTPFRRFQKPVLFLDFIQERLSWQKSPWYLRAAVEGIGIVFFALIAISLIPKIRSLYVQTMEKKIDQFLIADTQLESELERKGENNSADKTSPPLTRGNLSVPLANTSENTDSDDFSSEGEAEPLPRISSDSITARPSEIWRFNLKTDSPRDTRLKIIETFKNLQVLPKTPGFGGIEAPGGIQFDLLVSPEVIPPLKEKLKTIANEKQSATIRTSQPTQNGEAVFTWYKNKSKRSFTAGKSRVVIWLSQI